MRSSNCDTAVEQELLVTQLSCCCDAGMIGQARRYTSTATPSTPPHLHPEANGNGPPTALSMRPTPSPGTPYQALLKELVDFWHVIAAFYCLIMLTDTPIQYICLMW